MKNFYDKIIFGSSFDAVDFAIKSKLNGESVLLLNQFGFVGGEITESLDCYKPIKFFQKYKWFDDSKDAFFYKDSSSAVVNPEFVKFYLLEKLISYKIEFLFHITPLEIKFENNFAHIKILTKENQVLLTCNNLYDATDQKILFNVFHNKNFTKTISLNFFLTRPKNSPFFNSEKANLIQLNDERIFATLRFETEIDNFFNFDEFELVKSFELQIKNFGSKIQLLPLRPKYSSSLNEINIDDKLISLSYNFL